MKGDGLCRSTACTHDEHIMMVGSKKTGCYNQSYLIMLRAHVDHVDPLLDNIHPEAYHVILINQAFQHIQH